MPKIPPEGMSQIIPYLFYADVPKAVAWLEAAFGFEKDLADVDAHYARAKAAGAEIVNELSDQAYGRTYWARDPDGHDWFFTCPPG